MKHLKSTTKNQIPVFGVGGKWSQGRLPEGVVALEYLPQIQGFLV